jgi:hypothetical protein
MTSPAFLTWRRRSQAGWIGLGVDRFLWADFQHCRQLNKLGFVFVGVMLAEQQLASRR